MSTANSSYDSSHDSSQTFPLSFPLKVLLLGSGELGKELTISLQRLGVEVVAVDSYVAAPAMQVATQSRVVDMTDAQALRELITQVAPDLIVPEVEKLAASALVAAAAAGIRVVPTAKVVELTFDRQGIRTLAAQHAGVPTSPYAFADSFDALCLAAQEVGFPCFVKPTMSSSGHGQSRVTSPQGLHAAWEEASAGARADTGRVIVEGLRLRNHPADDSPPGPRRSHPGVHQFLRPHRAPPGTRRLRGILAAPSHAPGHFGKGSSHRESRHRCPGRSQRRDRALSDAGDFRGGTLYPGRPGVLL